MRRRAPALILLCVACSLVGVLHAAEPAGRRSPGPSRTAKLEKCEDCRTSLRRRLAVMPVVFEGAPEMSASRNALAEEIQARVRELLSRHGNLHALEPAEIAMASGPAGESSRDGGGRGPGRAPAQAELFLTASTQGVETELVREPSPAIDQVLKEAIDLENRSDLLRVEAGRKESRIEESARAANLAAAGDVDKVAALECREAAAQSIICGGDWECITRSQQQIRECQDGVRNRQLQKGARAAEDERSRLKSEVLGIRAESESLKVQGGVLRRKATLEGEEAARVTRRVRATVSVGWRLVDSRWGALIRAGSTNGAAAREEKGLPKASAADEASGRARVEAVVYEAVSEPLAKIAAEVSDAMGEVAPRVKVVKADASQITVNAGSVLGAAVGDTFGLVSRGVVMTDPDTGHPLETPPGPTGKYRVVEVAEQVALLAVVEKSATVKSGPIRRGDELEWIGVYGPYATKKTAAPPRAAVTDSR